LRASKIVTNYREDEADVLYSYPAQAEFDALDNAKALLGRPLLAVQKRVEATLRRHFQSTGCRRSVLTENIKIPRYKCNWRIALANSDE